MHQKLLQSAMRQWTASWCILVAQQALNLHQKWLAPVYQQWPFHQQCAAGHCWWWILSVLDNFNFLLREFYQSSLKNLERILDFSLFSTYTFWSFIQSAPQKQHFNHLAAKNDFENLLKLYLFNVGAHIRSVLRQMQCTLQKDDLINQRGIHQRRPLLTSVDTNSTLNDKIFTFTIESCLWISFDWPGIKLNKEKS